jgi:hypothetical protein
MYYDDHRCRYFGFQGDPVGGAGKYVICIMTIIDVAILVFRETQSAQLGSVSYVL